MPCRDYMDMPDDIEERRLRSEVNSQQDRLDKITRVACELEKKLSPSAIETLSNEAKTWVLKHREDDKRAEETRLRVEELKKQNLSREYAEKKLKEVALNKLTAKERKLLGL